MGSPVGFKMFSMSTTVRAIERIPDLMKTLLALEAKGMNFIGDRNDKKSKEAYVTEIIKGGFVKSNKVDDEILEKIEFGKLLSDDEAKTFMKQAVQKPEWSGRLSNYFNKTESLGLSYRDQIDNKVKTTKLGKLFVENPIAATKWSLINLPANNPLKRNLNAFTPMGVMVTYLKRMGKKRISDQTIALLISMHQQSDVESFNFENDWHHSMESLAPRMKASTIKDYVDEIKRTMIFSGFFTSGFKGLDATEHLLSNLDEIKRESEQSLKKFEKINTTPEMITYINSIIFDFESTETTQKTNAEKIKKLTENYTVDWLKNAISTIGKNEEITIDNINKDVKRYVIIEWLFALILAKDNKSTVIPNLSLDERGFPISHAGAGFSDIEVIEENGDRTSVEITLLTNRTQMLNNETTNLIRHAKKVGSSKIKFFAPRIHEDVQRYFRFASQDENIDIEANTFTEFIS
ncbi:hypothetical protein [Mycoplasma todarodis]|uniref:hypothetical protein n=1 Tax=Mycoplasma todarodis TaxID=1937191 RepID=UPI003B2B2970